MSGGMIKPVFSVDTKSEDIPEFKVLGLKLDGIHAMFRPQRTLKKGHGSFKPFMAMFRDAIYIVDLDDLERVKDDLKKRSYTDGQIKDLN